MLPTSVFRLLDLIDTNPSKQIRYSDIPEDLQDALTIALHHESPLVEKEPPPDLPKVLPSNPSPEARKRWEALAVAVNSSAANPTYSLTSVGRYELAMQRTVQREGAGAGCDQGGVGGNEIGAGGTQAEGQQANGTGTNSRRSRAGKRPLEKSNPLQLQVYQRIKQEFRAGEHYVDTIARLKSDTQFLEQVQEARLKLDSKLVRNALAFFEERERRSARNNQQIPPA
jgi:hypothetical protein